MSWSTSTYSWGTVGRKVVETVASSGRFLAASMKVAVLAARNSRSLPARSSSMKVTPPEVPIPGMAGGEKAKPTAPLRLPSFLLSACLMASYCTSGSVRSAQSSKVTKKKAL